MYRLLLCTALIASPAAAQTGFQDTSVIDRGVANFTGKPIGSEGGARAPVDARLKLASCAMVSMSWRAANHDSVVVSCTDPEWRVYVPVILAPTPISAPVAAAAPAPAKPQVVIKRGDPVMVEAGAPGFSITRDGVAMTDAVAGGRLLVDVDGVKKPIQAIALEPGHAAVPGFNL
ncbi:MAG: flagella basal body P-ring formation protein FlgA [Sphingomonas sp.]|uniref:flagella basal body P-ring formation protein FlgA n=1 Tax=Sphingomonas sp. TaxID=28214 RepID=UPI0035A87518|nr:flagella basal body P-ring formation protein FlgA [Sphingomonas sp.]